MNATLETAKTNPVHISQITAGDTIVHNGKLSTVCGKDIKRGGFCGDTIFGDSYHSGYKPVHKVVAWTNGINEVPVR